MGMASTTDRIAHIIATEITPGRSRSHRRHAAGRRRDGAVYRRYRKEVTGGLDDIQLRKPGGAAFLLREMERAGLRAGIDPQPGQAHR